MLPCYNVCPSNRNCNGPAAVGPNGEADSATTVHVGENGSDRRDKRMV